MLLDKEFLDVVAENGKLRVRIAELENKVTFEAAANLATAKLNANLLKRIAELEAALDDMHKGHDAICKYVSELEAALKPFVVKDTEVTPERQYYDMLVKHEDRVHARAALKGEM